VRKTIVIKQGLPAIHPGEYLSEILTELNISQTEFACAIGVSAMRISHIVKGTRPITAELALLVGRALDQSPQYWLNLQTTYDLIIAEANLGEQLEEVRLLARI
jgi:addiction module HigA family antidote